MFDFRDDQAEPQHSAQALQTQGLGFRVAPLRFPGLGFAFSPHSEDSPPPPLDFDNISPQGKHPNNRPELDTRYDTR